MSERILLNITPEETRIAFIAYDAVQDVLIERQSNRGIVGDIYLGRVHKVLPGMQAAFIDIGGSKNAFLQENYAGDEGQQDMSLVETQQILVQITKEAIGTKGARVQTKISLAGRLLVYTPFENHIGISTRIACPDERERLKHLIEQLVDGKPGGFIVRTVAELSAEEDLAADMAYLFRRWLNLENNAKTAVAPMLVYSDLQLPERVVRDRVRSQTKEIIIDSHECYWRVRKFAELYVPDAVDRLQLYRGDRPLFDLYHVDQKINEALAPRVNLASGGYLIIEQTEGLAVIDVNSGGHVGHSTLADTVLKVNLEAAIVVAEQIRLRNLGGIIMIDFIDMREPLHQSQVRAVLEKSLAEDPARISEFSTSGMIEIVRKRVRESLQSVLCIDCPECQGRGFVRSAQTVCYEINREIVREARRFEARAFTVIAHPSVISLLQDEESNMLMDLSDFVSAPIRLSAEASYARDQFNIAFD